MSALKPKLNYKFDPRESEIVLTDNERDQIKNLIEGFTAWKDVQLDDCFFTGIEIAARGIPERIAAALIEFRRNSNDCGTLLVRNLPFDQDLPATPEEGRLSDSKKTSFSEFNLLLSMSHLGEPLAYEDEKEGAIIQNVCPVKGEECRQENTGSLAFLKFHTEDGFHPCKPDYVGLICLRPDHERLAQTLTASVRTALDLIPARTISILREPLYRIRLSSSFMRGDNPQLYSSPMPVLSGDAREPDFTIDCHAMEAVEPSAEQALETMKSALDQVGIGWVLLPGDMVIVDNRVAAHARTPFKPMYDGQDRWLQRLFVVEDYRRTRASRYPGKHVCVSLGIELFNQTKAS